MAPLEGANVPLPPSVTSGPSRKTGQPSQKSPSVGNDVGNTLLNLVYTWFILHIDIQLLSPKSAARPMSPPRTANGLNQSSERSWTPRSAASQQQSRITPKTSRSAYPPLPESTMEDAMYSRAASPPARPHTKTPSIAPSESASQAPRIRSQKSVSQKEPSHKSSRSIRGASELNPPPEAARSTASRVTQSQRGGT